MPSFKNRSQDIEIMDNLLCEGEVVEQTLRELEVINRLLGGNHVTINGIKKLITERPQKQFSMVDLGCGGGDILKLVADWGAKNHYNFILTGIDANPNITSFAEKNSSGYKNIRYHALNIFSPEFKDQKFDITLATLFTHHFSNDELVELFKSLKKQTRIGIVINDIHRHWFAYHSIRLISRIFSKSAMLKFDAPLSVLRAFKKNELESILRQADITNYSLQWKWAFRWQVVIKT